MGLRIHSYIYGYTPKHFLLFFEWRDIITSSLQ